MSAGQEFRGGMEVRDPDGEKIGAVERVFREDESASLRTEPVGGESRFGSGYLQVAAEVAPIGRTLYVPFGSIEDLRDGAIYLDAHKEAVENREWDLRPSFLDEPQWREER